MNHALTLVPAIALTLLAGCLGKPGIPVSSGLIDRPGIVIAAEDGTFQLESGKQFVPPVQSDCWGVLGYEQEATVSLGSFNWGATVKVGDLALARRHCKGVPVRVTVPGRKSPLYGILVMNKINAHAPASVATKSYLIDVPDTYVTAAAGGQVSVVYETYESRSGTLVPTWVLWLSDKPLQ